MTSPAMALDINALWDYSKPDVSEQRFTAALAGASDNDQQILQTQIARSHGLRRNFDKAREVLSMLEPQLARSSPEVQTRYFLELGRTFASPVHPADARTPQNIDAARRHFMQAFDVGSRARLDYLAVDALHMMPFVDAEPDQQLAWNEKAVAYMDQSDQADAKKWGGSLNNNIGYARHLKGDYDGALAAFALSRAAHEKAGKVRNVRIADWMMAWTYRAQKKYDQALAMQLALERAWDADGDPDPYVYEELEHLYRATNDLARAAHYGAKLKATQKPG